MGRWGAGLLQGDVELDVVDNLSDEAGVTLFYPSKEHGGKDAAEVVKILNDGVLEKMYNGLKKAPKKNSLELVLLAVCAMQLGAKLSEAYLTLLRRIYIKSGIYEDGVLQFKDGLENYPNNGTPWDFISPGLIETANAAMSGSPKQNEEAAK